MSEATAGDPKAALSVVDAVAIIVGIVVGAGIFRTPGLVAQNAGSAEGALAVWLMGGVVSLLGAMCYAELATTWPHPGGEYHFLARALGRPVAFLFGWARLTVIPTGSIALLAFVFGDYASQIVPLGAYSSSIYAVGSVLAITGLNVFGLRQAQSTQNLLVGTVIVGLLVVIACGLLVEPVEAIATPVVAEPGSASSATWGLAAVFVLLTYGGWNEGAYISAEVRDGRRSIATALIGSLAIVTALYLLANAAYLRALGLERLVQSEAVAAELMEQVAGVHGAQLISLLIALAALTSLNATVITGARTHFALGRDFPLLGVLGRWSGRAGNPVNALLVQGGICLALVGLGALQRRGFETMVEYTAPVFWFFFLLTGTSLFVLRLREPTAERPFRVPLYPLTPLLFCAACAYLLYSSLAYTGIGALVGVAALALGLPLWFAQRLMPGEAVQGGNGGTT